MTQYNPEQYPDLNEAEFQDCYDKGYSDGYNDTDEYDASMSYGSQSEIEAYHQGVEDGSASR